MSDTVLRWPPCRHTAPKGGCGPRGLWGSACSFTPLTFPLTARSEVTKRKMAPASRPLGYWCSSAKGRQEALQSLQLTSKLNLCVRRVRARHSADGKRPFKNSTQMSVCGCQVQKPQRWLRNQVFGVHGLLFRHEGLVLVCFVLIY